MIKKLTISNYTLIDYVEINFDRGLHIVTGETGAGKSILLGALGLIMGDRADLRVISDPDKNCVIEAEIDISSYHLTDILSQWEADPSDGLNIRRVISGSGKSRAFINDLPVSLKSLQEISMHLIQIHNQFDNLDLGHAQYQLNIIDVLGDHSQVLEEYKKKYKEWIALKSEVSGLRAEVESFEKEKDFFSFQFDELEKAGLEKTAEEDIESVLEILGNADAIQQALQMAYFTISDSENSLLDQLKDLTKTLRQKGEGVAMIDSVINALQQESETLEQLARDCQHQSERIESDPEKLAALQQKQDEINRLLHKFKASDIHELISIKNELQSSLSRELALGQLISQKEELISGLEKQMHQLADKITDSRVKSAKTFCNEVENSLRKLSMPFVRLEGSFLNSGQLLSNGKDHFELLFSANKGTIPHPIREVASGGELSRLSLSIKSILAGKMSLPTLIFDEIEAGISGDIAMKMGYILKKLSADHQVINITHSAQIASQADLHFYVYKTHEKERSTTRLKLLGKQERIIEIAKMLSGDPPTQTALKNAEELIAGIN